MEPPERFRRAGVVQWDIRTPYRMWDRIAAACLNPAPDTRVAIRLGEIFTSGPGA